MTSSPNEKKQPNLQRVVFKERYQVEQLIGAGGMAWMYKGVDLQTSKNVAIKFLFSELSSREEICERFMREAELQATLEHPHIVRIIDFMEENGWFAIVQEWINGEDLAQWSEKNGLPLSEKVLLSMMLPVIQAVAYAHEKKIIHRDLKPQNIMLQQNEGKLISKLVDFGLAKVINSQGPTITGKSMGTPLFMPPEQIKDSKSVDTRADIYSIGVILYLLTTGRHPFEGSNRYQLFYKMMSEPPRPPDLENTALSGIILQCLQKDPESRFQTCRDLERAFRQALKSQGHKTLIFSQEKALPQMPPLASKQTEQTLGYGETALVLADATKD